MIPSPDRTPAAHTKTPLRVRTEIGTFGDIVDANGDQFAQVQVVPKDGTGQPIRQARAERIVKAVNAHDDLVAALQGFIEAFNCTEFASSDWPLADQALAALAKAAGK